MCVCVINIILIVQTKSTLIFITILFLNMKRKVLLLDLHRRSNVIIKRIHYDCSMHYLATRSYMYYVSVAMIVDVYSLHLIQLWWSCHNLSNRYFIRA
jgi:hypothetical protein